MFDYFTSNNLPLDPKGTPTQRLGGTGAHLSLTLDHVWVTSEVPDLDQEYYTVPSSDHVAIFATTSHTIPETTTLKSYKWCNWEGMKQTLRENAE
jgi:hypothetical protein